MLDILNKNFRYFLKKSLDTFKYFGKTSRYFQIFQKISQDIFKYFQIFLQSL